MKIAQSMAFVTFLKHGGGFFFLTSQTCSLISKMLQRATLPYLAQTQLLILCFFIFKSEFSSLLIIFNMRILDNQVLSISFLFSLRSKFNYSLIIFNIASSSQSRMFDLYRIQQCAAFYFIYLRENFLVSWPTQIVRVASFFILYVIFT